MAGVNKPDRWVALVHPNTFQPEGTFVDDDAPLPVKLVGSGGGGGSSSVVVSNILDGAGDSVMDAANNAIRVSIVTGTLSTGQADKTSFVEGAGVFQPIGGVFNETPASDPTEDQAAAARITAKRALHVNLRTAAGVELQADSAARLKITGPVPDDGVTFNTAAPVTMGGEDQFGFARVFRMGDAATLPDFRTMATAQYVNNPNNPSTSAWVRRVAFPGTHGNAWNGVLTGVNGFSALIDCEHQAFISILVAVDVDTSIRVLVSQNGANFHLLDTYSVSAGTAIANGYTIGARYIKLQSTLNVTATATIASKTG